MVFKNFSKKMQELIKEKGFIEPTLAQQLSVPHILENKNVLIIAPTGIGKTEACLLPLLDKISQNKQKPITILYITPMRSLNRDMLDRLFWWADKLGLEASVRHGDTSQSERAAQRELPSDILITTPETLGAILPGKKIKEHLKNVKYVVVDEIHELAESKRGTQLSVLLERLKEVAGDFQRIGLSATIGSPELIAKFLGENVKIIKAEAAKEYDIKVELPQIDPTIKSTAERLYIGDDTTARLMRLYDVIKQKRSVLTFTNTRQTAEVISSRLRAIDKDFKQEVHHGSLSKERRIKSEKMFKEEKLKALICTSSLELGMDIGSVDFVVQYMSPRRVEALIQRVGRAGHSVGKTSEGIILSGEEDIFESAVIAKFAHEKKLEEIKIHENALDVLAHQIVGINLEYYDIMGEKIYNIVKRAWPFRNLQKKEFYEIIKFLGQYGLLWLEPIYKNKNDNVEPDDFIVKRRKSAWTYYFENLSTIPDTRQLRIISTVEHAPVGFLDEAFIAEHGKSGNTFVCDGRAWKIIEVEEDKVLVEPVDDIESAIPAWEGELIPVPYQVADEVAGLRHFIKDELKEKADDIIEKLMKKYPIERNGATSMINLIKQQSKSHTVPDDTTFLIEHYREFIIIHACLGTRANDTLGRYLSAEITNQTGVSVHLKTDPYRIIFKTLIKPEKLKEIIENATEDIEYILSRELERSSLFKWRFTHVAKRFGIIKRNASFDRISLDKLVSSYENTPIYRETLREVTLEKLDMETVQDVLRKIKSGKIKIVYEKGLSKLGENGLVSQFSDIMKPRMPEKEIYEMFKRRLMHTALRLVCTHCANYSIIQEVEDIEEQPSCPKCQSGLIGVYSKYKEDPIKLLKKEKKIKNRDDIKETTKLTKAEERELAEIKRSASLLITYGKKYCMVQAGRGVGVETAARILAKMPKDEEQLLKYIYKAEKDFLRTKRYWK